MVPPPKVVNQSGNNLEMKLKEVNSRSTMLTKEMLSLIAPTDDKNRLKPEVLMTSKFDDIDINLSHNNPKKEARAEIDYD